jgi:MOSC domain-containing protein YiiM
MVPIVTAVSSSPTHSMGKINREVIRLVAGFGVDGDAHAGATVKHRSRVSRNAESPNLRQVHLIHAELHDELASMGLAVEPGRMGENITTRGIDLLALPAGTLLRFGTGAASIEITGLRNPCSQLDGIQPGLMAATLSRDADGRLIRKAGVMAVVLASGEIRPGDAIHVVAPGGPYRPLEPV